DFFSGEIAGQPVTEQPGSGTAIADRACRSDGRYSCVDRFESKLVVNIEIDILPVCPGKSPAVAEPSRGIRVNPGQRTEVLPHHFLFDPLLPLFSGLVAVR